MRKTKHVFSMIIVLTAIISAALGYFAAHTRGLFNMYHSDAEFCCYVLTEQSSTLVRNVDSSGINVNSLIDAIERYQKFIIPTDDVELFAGDKATILAHKDQVDKVAAMLSS